MGLSRGGFTSKLHLTVDALGNPPEAVLPGGQVADISVARELLEEHNNCNVIADKEYDSNVLVVMIENNDGIAVIPPLPTAKHRVNMIVIFIKERHLVEKFFSKIKEFRKIATRRGKLADVFLSFVYLASAFISLQ